MTSMRRVALVGLLCLTGCQVTEFLNTDAGPSVTVPGGFHAARFTPGHKAHLELKGEKRVACRDCHAIADAGFVSPPLELCANCHEPQTRQHHPLDGGVAMTCLTCHVFQSKQVGVRFEKWSCLTCHREAQGETKAITVHLENCASCHRPHEQPFTEAATCTECHALTVSHGLKGPTLADSCMGCHPPHTAAAPASQRCLTCHGTDKVPALARVSPQALSPDAHVGCGSCHPTHAFDRQNVKPCATCHKERPVIAVDKHDQCTTCHQPHQPHAMPKPCASCHKAIASANKHPASADGKSCTGCHPAHPASFEAPEVVACITCHDKQPFTGDVVHAATTRCDACHKPHTGAPKREALCVSCHADQVKLVKTNAGHAKCDDCHAGLPHGEPGEPKACLTCHQDKTPPQQGHRECASCHESHSARVTTTCATCHLTPTSPALPGLHAVVKHRDCKTCHAPHTPEPGAGPKTCATCHGRPSQKNHPTPPTQCTGCHLFK